MWFLRDIYTRIRAKIPEVLPINPDASSKNYEHSKNYTKILRQEQP